LKVFTDNNNLSLFLPAPPKFLVSGDLGLEAATAISVAAFETL
jgi:hypothetical protein